MLSSGSSLYLISLLSPSFSDSPSPTQHLECICLKAVDWYAPRPFTQPFYISLLRFHVHFSFSLSHTAFSFFAVFCRSLPTFSIIVAFLYSTFSCLSACFIPPTHRKPCFYFLVYFLPYLLKDVLFCQVSERHAVKFSRDAFQEIFFVSFINVVRKLSS